MKVNLTKTERQQLTDLLGCLSKALEPIKVPEPADLAALEKKRAELVEAIQAEEQLVNRSNVEHMLASGLKKSAQQITQLRTQLGLVEGRVAELRTSHQAAVAKAEKQSGDEAESQSLLAREALAEVSKSFFEQHRAAVTEAVERYVTANTSVSNVLKMLPWFHNYLVQIRRFETAPCDSSQLVEFLKAALDGRDFLV